MGYFKMLISTRSKVAVLVWILFVHQLSVNASELHSPKPLEANSGRLEGLKRSETLDEDGKFNVEWKIDPTGKEITFEVRVQTEGWVGFGISPSGGMTGADIVIGGVHPDGKPYFTDRYAESNGDPTIDKSQDWKLLGFWERDGITSLKFSRLLLTCDEQDVAITKDTQRFIWAIGKDDKIRYHEGQRGSHVVSIMDPPRPQIFLSRTPNFYRIPYNLPQSFEMYICSFQKLKITTKIKIPKGRNTLYWCSLHKTPDFDRKQHAVAFGPNLSNPSAKKYSHHLQISHCKVPPGRDSRDFFDPFVTAGGGVCGDPSLTFQDHCTSMTYAWALGATVLQLPENVGFLIGESGTEYYMMNLHLNNPTGQEVQDFVTGINIYYTDQVRPTEAGYLSIHHWPNSRYDMQNLIPTILVPPSSTNFKVSGHCSSDCLSKIEPEGYTLINVQLHSHKSGRKMRLRHFRGDKELPWISNDETYDNRFQSMRNISPVKVLPKDHLIVECFYDNNWVSPPGVVFGGESTQNEMCSAILFYYPRGRVKECGSHNTVNELLRILGIHRVEGGDDGYEKFPRIEAPPHLVGQRLDEYVDRVVNWTVPLRQAVEEIQSTRPQVDTCDLEGAFDQTDSVVPSLIYPRVHKVYSEPKDTCVQKWM